MNVKKMMTTLAACSTAAFAVHAGKLEVRPKNFIVTPSTGPVHEFVVKNTTSEVYEGTLTPTYLKEWKIEPTSRKVSLKPGEEAIYSFAIVHGGDLENNNYSVSSKLTSAKHGQQLADYEVVCASTPYYKPEIDGKLTEWADAIPVEFKQNGKHVKVMSYWNKKQFCLAVTVEEDKLVGKADGDRFDALQFSLAPGKSKTASSASEKSVRYEYLVADSGSFWKGDACYQLMKPGQNLAEKVDDLDDLKLDGAEAKVSHDDGVTTYEIAVPMKKMKSLRATAGREYNFSLLIHGDENTTIDLGSVMNLSESARNNLSWTQWGQPTNAIPFDNKIEFGFCSSIH